MNTSRLTSLILIPALLTLAITLLRLTGELMNWAPALFNKAAGGGGALVGITWLVPVFGFYFAWRLLKSNELPTGLGRVFGFSVLALVSFGVFFAVALHLQGNLALFSALCVVGTGVGLFLARKAWPALFSTLFAYGLAARIPVIIIMFFAIMGNWGTHYDVPPPNFPDTAPFAKWLAIGLLPQLTFWIVFTVTIGLIFGGIAVAVLKRSPAMARAGA